MEISIKKLSHIYILCLLLSLFVIYSSTVTIMSVDFGSECLKVAVVAPGIPMEIALNKESKRKTPSSISFRDGERMFGDDALTAGMRSPASNYFYLLDLLGKETDNPIVDLYRERFPYYKIEAHPETNTVVFRHDENTLYSVEELVAQLLDHARQIATSYTNQKIKDLVIVVPPFFNQAEKRAILAAAHLASLKVLSLMSSDAAVALNYGMFRRKEINDTAQYILFYDMGASSTTATIVSYQTVKTKDRGFTETNPQLTIHGLGYDRTLGGLEMQLRLRDFLAKKFNEMKKTPNDVFSSPRAMGKIMKEAGRLKTVLSANTEHISQIEGVLDDQDFRLKVTREEFESLCGDLFERVRSPVDAALISAGMDISNIDQLIVVGGSTRVPRVQSVLQELWGRELGKNINADEAAAVGAVYRAADLGQGFKVMKFHVKESIVFPVEVDFERKIEGEQGAIPTVKVVKRSLFAVGNHYPQKKVMTFNKHTSDFGFAVNYGDLGHLSKQQISSLGNRNISYIMVRGVTKAFEEHLSGGDDAESKGIKAHFTVVDSGLLQVTGVEAVFEKNITVEEDVAKDESTLSKIGSTLSKLFTGSEDEEGKAAANNTDTKEEEEKKKKSDDNAKENKTDKKEKDTEKSDGKKEKEVKFKVTTIKEQLNFTVNYLDLKTPSAEHIQESKQKLLDINKREELRKQKEEGRNTLETYILEVQDKLLQEEYEAASVPETREKLQNKASELEEWLYDEGFHQEPSVYKEHLKSLEKLFEPIRERVREHRERPEALKALQEMINISSLFLHKVKESPEDEKWFTDVEINTLDDLLINTQKWLEVKEEEQQNTALSDDPKLSLSAIAEKITEMDREIKYLVNKAKMAKAKKEREEAEAKIKAKEEAEKAAKEAAKNNIAENKENGEEAEANVEEEKESRQEPPLPVDEEEVGENTLPKGGMEGGVGDEENDSETDRRKSGEAGDSVKDSVHEEM